MIVSTFITLVVIAWIATAALTALYGWGNGYPFLPLLIAALGVGFAVVLLVITVAVGPDRSKTEVK